MYRVPGCGGGGGAPCHRCRSSGVGSAFPTRSRCRCGSSSSRRVMGGRCLRWVVIVGFSARGASVVLLQDGFAVESCRDRGRVAYRGCCRCEIGIGPRLEFNLGSFWGRSGVNLQSILGWFRVDLRSIWCQHGIDMDLMYGRFGVDLHQSGVDMRSIRGGIAVTLGSICGRFGAASWSIYSQSAADLGTMWGRSRVNLVKSGSI